MTIFKDSSGSDVKACDGCGREDAGPSTPLDIKDYVVHDANVGSKVLRHYCAHCASNRNASLEVLQFAGESGRPSLATAVMAVDTDDK